MTTQLACRVCWAECLTPVLSLGQQALTGVFPKSPSDAITTGPLALVWCRNCTLLQLSHTYDQCEMYGANYGYRSGLNQSMVDHLRAKVRHLIRVVDLAPHEVVLDIGSNDATLLKAYSPAVTRIGIDPTGDTFREYYTDGIVLMTEFFSSATYRNAVSGYRAATYRPARIITSIAMFYDLSSPIEFAQQIEEILADDGVWHFEQSYMPSMLRMNSYDTICHEHLEYYSLSVVKRILSAADLAIADVTMNAVNGGSFAVTAVKESNHTVQRNSTVVDWLLEQENRMGLRTPHPYREFEDRVFRHRDDLTRLIRALRADGKTILGYGASTKGNVLLQFCGLTREDISAIAEVNTTKFGHVTPGTHIPIVSEEEARAMRPDYFLVLPWHFKEGILRREKDYLNQGGKMIFPFPEIEIV